MEEQKKKSQHAEREERILKFWQEHKIFEKSLAKKAPKGEFVFFEGPPTANGKPGIHHIEARAFKDAIPRYKTMRGFHVRRKAGWDTHGLAVEIEVEKKLGLKSKKEIESFGVEEFNKKCKKSTLEYIDLWKRFTERVGFWTDFGDAYFTFDNDYIESLWNIIAKVSEKNLLYKDYRVAPWCARCGTVLSSHELAQGYQDVKDLSVTAKFKMLGQENTYFLAWTTTPWTLPGNIALAVGDNVDYILAKVGEEIFIIAEARISVLPEGYEILKKIKVKELIGLSYEPLYAFLKDNLPEGEKNKLQNAWKIYPADFVNTEEGTGIVHTAVMYGQDDFALGTKVGLPKYHLVKEDGTFKEECGFLAGRHVKTEETDVEIIKDLAHRGLLFKKEKHEHSYPHCWRCKTPLIYYARDSWYIGMSRLRDTLVKENEKINWEPAHIKNGRFGEWLREVKDWAISRERYWGTPLPVWRSEDSSETLVVDSIDTLKKHIKRSGNRYFVMRHGGTEGNAKGIVSFKNQMNDHLTDHGKTQIKVTAEGLKKHGIDIIVSSPFTRTRETAEAAAEKLGVPKASILIDDRLHEVNPGDFDGKAWNDYHHYLYDLGKEWYDQRIPNGESLKDVQKRMLGAIYELDAKYKDKKILLVTHGGPAWILFISAGLDHVYGDRHPAKGAHHFVDNAKRFDNAEARELDFAPLPHNENFELDLHKPYIDEIELVSEDGKKLRRVKEVMDVWFDSGAMPFAQDHYPFESAGKRSDLESSKRSVLEEADIPYPADFISEAIDQTRGWFYTLHAIGALMGRGRAYKNVICLGHLLDKEGKKMSKSIGNVLDPWEQMNKWGVDALRLWMYSVNQPGESKNYDEKTVDEVNKKFFNLVSNVFSFYELYRDKSLETIGSQTTDKHVLDRWVLIKLDGLIQEVTENLESYKLLEPVRAIRGFIDDLSTWYLQLSRDRFREGDAGAKQTLYFVLKTLSKIFAPFAPFFAEDLYQKLRLENELESVHLESWPTAKSKSFISKIFGGDKNKRLLEDMEKTRKAVSIFLDLRMKENIKVRQPLASVELPVSLHVPEENQMLIRERVNVKSSILGTETKLDTTITPELREEGIVREIIRFVQDLRKKQGLTPNDKISLIISPNPILQKEEWQKMLQSAVLADNVSFEDNAGEKIQIEGGEFSIQIRK